MKRKLPDECCGRCRSYSSYMGMRAAGFCLKKKLPVKAKERCDGFRPDR